MTTLDILKNARSAVSVLAQADSNLKNRALYAMANALVAHQANILAANARDLEAARGKIAPVMLDRLALSEVRIADMAEGIRQVADLPDPVGKVLRRIERPNGLVIEKTAVPMGVVAIIYESRPNVTSDAAALALKSGNVCVLRGGKEAFSSANSIVEALRAGLRDVGLPETLVNLIQDTSRQSANDLMQAVGYVDLLIPRGGAGLIRAVTENPASRPEPASAMYMWTGQRIRRWRLISSKTQRPAALRCAMRRKLCWCTGILRRSSCQN